MGFHHWFFWPSTACCRWRKFHYQFSNPWATDLYFNFILPASSSESWTRSFFRNLWYPWTVESLSGQSYTQNHPDLAAIQNWNFISRVLSRLHSGIISHLITHLDWVQEAVVLAPIQTFIASVSFAQGVLQSYHPDSATHFCRSFAGCKCFLYDRISQEEIVICRYQGDLFIA